jgi:hypothetical protein
MDSDLCLEQVCGNSSFYHNAPFTVIYHLIPLHELYMLLTGVHLQKLNTPTVQ